MCRRNQLCGSALVAFGLGLLVGMCLESGFFCFTVGIAIMVMGLWCMKKR